MKDVLTRIAWKNHRNGALNPRAQFRKEVAKDTIACSPIIAGPLGIFDCSGVCDGSAAAIVVRAEDAYKYTDKPIFVKALSFVAGPAAGPDRPDLRLHDRSARSCARPRTPTSRPASPTRAPSWPWPRCTTASRPTELVLMEDLGFAERGMAWKEVLAGTFDLDGELPVNPDGGLKSFGHPIGASGLRMLFEAGCSCAARPGRAPDRQRRRRQDARRSPTTSAGAAGRVRQLRVGRRLGAWLSADGRSISMRHDPLAACRPASGSRRADLPRRQLARRVARRGVGRRGPHDGAGVGRRPHPLVEQQRLVGCASPSR